MRSRQTTVTAAAAISEHPLPTHAVGDAVGEVLGRLQGRPDLAVVFVTGNHAGALEDIAATARSILRPRTLIGAASASILGGHREVEERPAVAVWAATCGAATPVRIRTARMDRGWSVTGLPRAAAEGERVLLLLADPHSFPTEGFLAELETSCPNLRVVGGLTSGALGPGGSRLILDDEQFTSGAVGVLFEPGAPIRTLVSQGTKAIGEPFVVTHSDRNHLLELGGRSAVSRLRDILGKLSPAERATAAQGLQVGIVVDESQLDFGPNDFVVRRVLGADPKTGVIGLPESVEVGQTVQFHVRDAVSADTELRAALSGISGAGALVFTDVGRGQRMFGYPDHDADVVSALLETRATAGMFSAGEIGPIHTKSLLHSLSTSIAIFGT